MKVLLIEDDKKISSLVQKGLTEAGFTVDLAFDGESGLSLFNTFEYRSIILDIMLPKMNGLTVLEKIRQISYAVPVIILSAKESIDDRVRGLQLGGDDYLVKPFSFTELLARVQALVRRGAQSQQNACLQFEDLSMNLLTREVKRNNTIIDLHAKEFILLEYLLQNQGTVLSKTQILEKVWGYSFDPQTNVVDVLVCRLRNKIDKASKVKIIQTIRGVGYAIKKG
jgi:DNA-binding response OmpR family regulator